MTRPPEMDISFSERLSNILALSTAVSSWNSGQGDSREDARKLENEIFNKATSKEDYQLLFSELITEQTEPDAAGSSVMAEDVLPIEILNPDGPDIGEYSHSTFHADGQMSTVFKARAKGKDAPEAIVALKITIPSAMSAPHNSLREARLLRTTNHQSVVPLLESFRQPGGRFVLAFPFLRQDLENLLRSGVFTKQQGSLVFRGLFDALAHIHSLGIIHRDVKPSNILLKTMNGPAYLADFGIAWSPNDPDSEAANSKITDVGTTSYRPPELLFGDRSYDTSLDMWAAGCVVAEMLKPDHSPMFDAGPLGSELGMIKSIFTTLGTPNDDNWPSAKNYPDWGKMRFQQFPPQPWIHILPGAAEAAIDFVKETVCFESTRRLTAEKALQQAALLGW